MGALLSLTDMLARSRHLESQSRLAQNPDGLILLGKCPPDLLPFLKKQYAHIIGIDRNPTGFDYDEVFCDGQRAAETVMEYLISLGHKRIAYIGDCSYEARYIGYHQSLLAHKLPLNYAMVYQTGQTRREGSLATRRILEETVRPTAIFCANDSTALGVLDELKAGRRKKYRPSVISIDNIREAQECTPLLTTMDIPKREMAHYAVLVLLDRIRGGHREHVRIELPGKLIVRESCGYCAE